MKRRGWFESPSVKLKTSVKGVNREEKIIVSSMGAFMLRRRTSRTSELTI